MPAQRGLIVALFLAVGAAPVRAVEPPAADVVRLAMTDQFGARHDTAQFRGNVLIVVFSDKQGAEASRDLGRQLHVLFHPTAEGLTPAESARAPVRDLPDWPAGVPQPDVKLLAVAVIGDVPSVLHGYVRQRFRSASPDAPVWLDLSDTMRTQFQVRAGVPNLLVIDVQGRRRLTTAGIPNDAQLAEFVAYIEQLRLEARP